MKKRTLIVALLAVVMIAVVAVASFAKGGRHGAGWHHGPGGGGFGYRFEMMMERAAERLDLSKDQRDKVFAVVDETHPTMRQLRFAFKEQRQAFMQLDPAASNYSERLKEVAHEASQLASQAVFVFGETRAKIAALLTEEQRNQMKQMIQEHRQHGRGKH